MLIAVGWMDVLKYLFKVPNTQSKRGCILS